MRHLNLLLTCSFAAALSASAGCTEDDPSNAGNTGTDSTTSSSTVTSSSTNTETGNDGSVSTDTNSSSTPTETIETTSTSSSSSTCSGTLTFDGTSTIWDCDGGDGTNTSSTDDGDGSNHTNTNTSDGDDDDDDDDDNSSTTSTGTGTDTGTGTGTDTGTNTTPRECDCQGLVDNEEILLLGANKHVYRFDPSVAAPVQAASAFAELNGAGCAHLETPFSMAVKADGTAIVADTDGDLFSVTLKNGSVGCSLISYAKATDQHPEEIQDDRLALAVRLGDACEETVFFHTYAGVGVGNPQGTGYLGTFSSGVLSLVGDAPHAQAEIGFDGEGNLYAATLFAAKVAGTSQIVNLDANNGETVPGSTPVALPGVRSERSYAYARSGGADYVFYDINANTSAVYAAGKTFANIPVRIVGAAVMHCQDNK